MTPRKIGIRYPTWSSYGPAVLEGITAFAEQGQTWRIVTENNSFGEMETVKIDRDWEGDGLVLFRATDDELQSFRQRGIAVVVTSSEGPCGEFPRVISDNHEIGRLAAGHLIACGMPNHAFIGRGETIYLEPEHAPGMRRYTRERMGGFKSALAKAAKRPVVNYLTGRPLWEEGAWQEVEDEVAGFLRTLPLPCGVFAVDDALAAVVMRAAVKCGLRVPEDLAVIGYGNDPSYCFSSVPSLSTIMHPSLSIGMLAARRLAEQFEGQSGTRIDRIKPGADDILSRGSSDTLGVPDPEIKKLLSFIRLNAPHDAIRVSELTSRTDLSLTTIKARFNEFLGHGPKDEIQRVRIQHLKSLLRQTRLPLPEIVHRMRFSSGQDMSRFFFRATGCSPTSYRTGELNPVESIGPETNWGVVFDLDGTLVDTETVYFDAYRRALEVQGFELTPDLYEREFLGAGNKEIERRLATMIPEPFDHERFRMEWRKLLRSMISESPPIPLPGVIESLEILSERGVLIGLASSSDLADIRMCLEKSGLSGYFRCIAAGDEVPCGKPDPAVYRLCCERMGIDASRSYAVEDSGRGISAGVAAGLRVFALRGSGYHSGEDDGRVTWIDAVSDVAWGVLSPESVV